MDFAYHMENAFVRMTTSATELTYLKRSLIKFLGIDYSNLSKPEQDLAQAISQTYYSFEAAKRMKRIKNIVPFEEVVQKTARQVTRIQSCYSKIEGLVRMRIQTNYSSRLRKLFQLFSSKALAGVPDFTFELEALKQLEEHILALMELIQEQHSSLLYDHHYISLRLFLLEDKEIKTSDKLQVIVETISDWLKLVSAFFQNDRYLSTPSCRCTEPFLLYVAKQLYREYICFNLLKRSIRILERRMTYRLYELSDKPIKNAYVRLIKLMHGDTNDEIKEMTHRGLQRRRSSNLYRTVCVRNAMYRSKSVVLTRRKLCECLKQCEDFNMTRCEKIIRTINKSVTKLRNSGTQAVDKLKATAQKVTNLQLRLDNSISREDHTALNRQLITIEKFLKLLSFKKNRLSEYETRPTIFEQNFRNGFPILSDVELDDTESDYADALTSGEESAGETSLRPDHSSIRLTTSTASTNISIAHRDGTDEAHPSQI